MRTSSLLMQGITCLSTLLGSSYALGINCRGSGLCDRATMSSSSGKIVQILRDAVWAASESNSTTYGDGSHIICISQTDTVTISASAGGDYDGVTGSFSLSGDLSVGAGGICLFPQGASLSLEQIRPLTDAILEHGCSTCGSVPIHFVDQGSNDPSDGILTFNYVENPFCDQQCISDTGASSGNPTASKVRRSAKFGPGGAVLRGIDGE
ncbi:hypothetical protein HO133_001544 [Letharia lupina]|uniref:Killer toxin Kp4 domain-containing protein n=1 Tax=Letharia lupina TaxID=560253 RepID=A0A8H6CFJ2_9LECA|nr:uncharacterized protein HO133_001544 [Letharia lupina]KAF6222458.1 hypothetical protein HO133_001544 [Letharia lupina]